MSAAGNIFKGDQIAQDLVVVVREPLPLLDDFAARELDRGTEELPLLGRELLGRDEAPRTDRLEEK